MDRVSVLPLNYYASKPKHSVTTEKTLKPEQWFCDVLGNAMGWQGLGVGGSANASTTFPSCQMNLSSLLLHSGTHLGVTNLLSRKCFCPLTIDVSSLQIPGAPGKLGRAEGYKMHQLKGQKPHEDRKDTGTGKMEWKAEAISHPLLIQRGGTACGRLSSCLLLRRSLWEWGCKCMSKCCWLLPTWSSVMEASLNPSGIMGRKHFVSKDFTPK